MADLIGQPIVQTAGDAAPHAVGGVQAGLSLESVATPRSLADGNSASLYETAVDLTQEASFAPGGTLTGSMQVLAPIDKIADMYSIYRLSPLLEPVISALVANVYASGYTLRALINPERPDGRERVREALEYVKAATTPGKNWFELEAEASDEDIDAACNAATLRLARERQYIDAFFRSCCPGSSFLYLCHLTGLDLEVGGRAYWEVIRSGVTGDPVQLVWAPAWSIRPTPLQSQIVARHRYPLSDIKWEERLVARRFRSYVQLDGRGSAVARFKQFGDQRVMSVLTGEYYNTVEEMAISPKEQLEVIDPTTGERKHVFTKPATELLEFKIPSPTYESFGKASWTGCHTGAVGTRDLDEFNKGVVTDQVIPQMFLFVSGGAKIAAEDVKALQEQIQQRKETQGGAGLYILQAMLKGGEGDAPTSEPKIAVIKAKSEQHTDALGLKYKADAYADMRRAYRMPKVALGDADGINKATADYMSKFTEAQVYDPRRDLFSAVVQQLLWAMGIELTTFQARSRQPKEPKELSEVIRNLVEASVLTTDEARQFSIDIFNKELPDLVGLWTKLPKSLITAILQTKNQLVASALLSGETEIVERLQEALGANLTARRSEGAPDDEGQPPDGSPARTGGDGTGGAQSGEADPSGQGGPPPG